MWPGWPLILAGKACYCRVVSNNKPRPQKRNDEKYVHFNGVNINGRKRDRKFCKALVTPVANKYLAIHRSNCFLLKF